MTEVYIWYCLECKKEIPIKKIEKNKCCPNCKCTYFNVKIYEKS